MSDTAVLVLRENLEGLKRSLEWLKRSNDRCLGIGVKRAYSPDEFDQFENLTSRYARTTDLIISKILRSIDAVEFLEPGSVIDAANRAEKRGIVESVTRLRELKDLRNEIAHEYTTDDLSGLFSAVLKAVPDLFDTAERILGYCEKYEDQ